MSSKSPKDHHDRNKTDQSLSEERSRSDSELARSQKSIESSADDAVHEAREAADVTLEQARTEANATLDAQEAGASEAPALRKERRAEDLARTAERRSVDRRLADERWARQQAIVELLRAEREVTDESLFFERRSADAAIDSRDEFLAMVSHDLRTLLGGISLSAALLRRRGEASAMPDVTREADRLRGMVARMNHLIGDLVDVASIEVGRLSVIPKAEDARRLLRETLEAFQAVAADRGVSLNGGVDSEAVLATIDHERILQVLANLVGNAIKFTPEGGRITLRVVRAGAEVHFSVVDSGPGIPQEQLARIFERFWQVQRADRRGLGLGLYISRVIIEAHGGRIWAENLPTGGARIVFTLPAATA